MSSNLVLVTGADGFIGSHLAEMLIERGHHVRALCQYNAFGTSGWLDNSPVRDQLEIVMGDVRDAHQWDAIIEGVDAIYHLAALIAVPYSFIAPDSYIDTNVTGALNMLQAARRHLVRRIIHVSSSEVYGTARSVPISEQHPLHPQSPYAASKAAADHLALSFHASFDLPVVIARPFNTYGPRQSVRAVIPTIIGQIAAGRPRVAIGNTTPTRDFTFVTDTCQGLLALGACDDAIGRVVNIGSNTEVSIADTFQLIRELMNADVELEDDPMRVRSTRAEVYRLRCDNTLMRELTGFTPSVDWRSGLRRTIDWFTDPARVHRDDPGAFHV